MITRQPVSSPFWSEQQAVIHRSLNDQWNDRAKTSRLLMVKNALLSNGVMISNQSRQTNQPELFAFIQRLLPTWNGLRKNPVVYSALADYYDFLSGHPYFYAAQLSAREMSKERDEVLQDLGRPPIGFEEKNANEIADVLYSMAQFFWNDFSEFNGWSMSLLDPDYDVQPYTPAEASFADFTRNDRLNKKRQSIATQLLNLTKLNVSQLPEGLQSSVQTIKDISTAPLPIDPVFPVIGNLNRDFVAEKDSDRAMRAAMREASRLDELASSLTVAERTWLGNQLEYWKRWGPKVELLPAQNKHLSRELLLTPFAAVCNHTGKSVASVTPLADGAVSTGNAIGLISGGVVPSPPAGFCQNPPMVFLQVTPQTKPAPRLSWFAKNAHWLSLAVSVIPGIGLIGTAVSQGIAVAQKQALNAAVKGIRPSASVFEPSYRPRPFLVALPLPFAQFALVEPWRLPLMSWRIRDASGGEWNPFQ